MLVYTTQDPQEGYIPDGNLKISSLKTGVADTTTLWPQNSEIIESLAWSPDGQSLAISLPRNEKHPLRIDQITLKGEHSNLLTLGEAGIKENESYNHEVIKEALDYAVELALIRDNPADQKPDHLARCGYCLPTSCWNGWR
ncbi:MAG: hypothetical protein PHW03_06495 [Eubacteriales bacterium]|nr:hypothetical protein [Eubacteriales bacterium]